MASISDPKAQTRRMKFYLGDNTTGHPMSASFFTILITSFVFATFQNPRVDSMDGN
jgi:hypothetical protein